MSDTDTRSPLASREELERLLTQFGELEAELERIQAELTHSHRLATVGTITSTVAHEYNNILTPVISYAQFALANPGDTELTRKALRKALGGAQRAAQISSSLLGFAREEADAGPAELRRVVAEALACLGRPPERDGIRLEVDVPDVRLAMSELSLQQVLLNLILNARKAMRSTGGTLRLRGRIVGNHLELDVADTGPGIPPELQARLFEPFVTAGSDEPALRNGHAHGVNTVHHDPDEPPRVRCDSEKGTGLGLTICRKLLHHADGDIGVTSTPGEGATFHLSIPLADTDEVLTT